MDIVKGFIILTGAEQRTEIKLGKYCSSSGTKSTQTYKVKDVHPINHFSATKCYQLSQEEEREFCLANLEGPTDE